MEHSIDVALTGAAPTGAECLGLAYVAQSLRSAGHHPSIITYRGIGDLDNAARRAVRLSPRLIGVAMPSGDAAIESLAFVYRIRQLGYRGHVTCGGTYATLARRLLLERHQVLDFVIRHDGELPVVALADALARGGDVTRLPGVSTRDAEEGSRCQTPSFVTCHMVENGIVFCSWAGNQEKISRGRGTM